MNNEKPNNMIAYIEQRTKDLFADHTLEIAEKTDRMFAKLMVLQFIVGITFALTVPSHIWMARGQQNLFVWDAMFFGSIIAAGPIVLSFTNPGKLLTRYVVAVAQMLFGALFIHLTGGRIEAYSHILVSLAVLVFYRDWRVLVAASVVVLIYNLAAGIIWPDSIFGISGSKSLRLVEHTVWMVIEDMFLYILCIRREHEMERIAQNTAELEYKNEQLADRERQLIHLTHNLDKKVSERTVELHDTLEELKTTHTQLIQSEKLASIGQLAAGVAHEINNPVGFISNNMEILSQYISEYNKIISMADDLKRSVDLNDLQKSKEIASKIDDLKKEMQYDFVAADIDKLLKHNLRGIERIQKIVMDLRAFAREDKNVVELVKIEEVIDTVLGIVHNELKYKAEVTKEYGNTPMIKCNTQRIGQVFINLLVNAAQAIKEKGTIHVRTFNNGKNIGIEVKDSGMGIPPENLSKIFDAFFTTKPVGQGTGLGLSLSYDIIKKHGGDIKVRSKLGEGTVFTVILPIP